MTWYNAVIQHRAIDKGNTMTFIYIILGFVWSLLLLDIFLPDWDSK